jgi:hypothetical protein
MHSKIKIVYISSVEKDLKFVKSSEVGENMKKIKMLFNINISKD